MCLEESFCPFTRDALNFRQPKYMLHRTPQQCSGVPLSLNRHHCAVWRSAISFCIVNHSCSPEKQSPLKYTESSFLLISHWFTRSDVMSINSYYAIISLYEWKTETCVFLYHAWRLSEDINTWTSPELLWESLHERFIWVKAFHILISQKCKCIPGHGQNKNLFFWRQCSRNIFPAECT